MHGQTRTAADDPVTPRAKRPRAAQACDRCRLKKYKCDELYPCSHCKSKWASTASGIPQRGLTFLAESHIDCVYQGTYRERESNRSAR